MRVRVRVRIRVRVRVVALLEARLEALDGFRPRRLRARGQQAEEGQRREDERGEEAQRPCEQPQD